MHKTEELHWMLSKGIIVPRPCKCIATRTERSSTCSRSEAKWVNECRRLVERPCKCIDTYHSRVDPCSTSAHNHRFESIYVCFQSRGNKNMVESYLSLRKCNSAPRSRYSRFLDQTAASSWKSMCVYCAVLVLFS